MRAPQRTAPERPGPAPPRSPAPLPHGGPTAPRHRPPSRSALPSSALRPARPRRSGRRGAAFRPRGRHPARPGPAPPRPHLRPAPPRRRAAGGGADVGHRLLALPLAALHVLQSAHMGPVTSLPGDRGGGHHPAHPTRAGAGRLAIGRRAARGVVGRVVRGPSRRCGACSAEVSRERRGRRRALLKGPRRAGAAWRGLRRPESVPAVAAADRAGADRSPSGRRKGPWQAKREPR